MQLARTTLDSAATESNTSASSPVQGSGSAPLGDDFARALRRCLENLNNPQALATNPLADLKIVQAYSARRTEKLPLRLGLALHDVIVEAIEQLKPEPDEPDVLDESAYPYVILNSRFVRNNRHSRYESIANKLAVSKSTYYRRLDEATQLLGAILNRMNTDADVDDTAPLSDMNAAAAAPPIPNHEYFVGRESLLGHIKQLLANQQGTDQQAANTIGLWGLPGSGKTTLLVQLANDLDIRALFPDGILWGTLGCNPNLAALTHAWCLAMRVPGEKLSEAASVLDKTKLLHAALADCRVLIIVDDVWDAARAIPLKVRGRHTRVLFNSRFPDVAAALAGANILKVGELTAADSFAMLKAYAPFAVEQCPDKAQSLAATLGGLPLALVIAGQYLQQAAFAQQPRRVQQAFAQLEDALFRLTVSDSAVLLHGADPSQRTLRAVVDQSVQMLSPVARRALNCLCLLPAKPQTFSEEAALEIAETSYEALDELVNMGLLDVALGDGTRYAIHQLIADYVLVSSRTDQDGQAQARRRMARYFANWVQRNTHEPNAVRAELPNLLFAVQLAQQHAHEGAWVELALGLYPHLEAWGLWSIGEQVLSGLPVCGYVRRTPALHADILLKLAHCYFLQRQIVQAEAFVQAVEMLVAQSLQHSHAEWISRIYELRANILLDKGEHRKAVDCCTRALEAATEARAHDLAEQARHTMAVVFSVMGEYDRLEQTIAEAPTQTAQKHAPSLIVKTVRQARLYQCQALALAAVAQVLQGHLVEGADKARAALDVARNTENHRWIVLSLEWLGWICALLGQYDEVLRLMDEALTLVREGDFKEDITFLYVNLGLVAKARGSLDEAEVHLANALAIADETPVGRMNGKATLYGTQARIQLAKGKWREAELSALRSLEVADNKMEIIPTLAVLGYIKARQGDVSACEGYSDEAFRRARRLGSLGALLTLFATHYRGETDLLLGRYSEAVNTFTEAHRLAARTRSPELIGITGFGLARAMFATGQRETAAMQAQGSLEHLQSIGHVYVEAMQDFLNRTAKGESWPDDCVFGF
jgi:tetratricopeptide (TPR) repeat protein